MICPIRLVDSSICCQACQPRLGRRDFDPKERNGRVLLDESRYEDLKTDSPLLRNSHQHRVRRYRFGDKNHQRTAPIADSILRDELALSRGAISERSAGRLGTAISALNRRPGGQIFDDRTRQTNRRRCGSTECGPRRRLSALRFVLPSSQSPPPISQSLVVLQEGCAGVDPAGDVSAGTGLASCATVASQKMRTDENASNRDCHRSNTLSRGMAVVGGNDMGIGVLPEPITAGTDS